MIVVFDQVAEKFEKMTRDATDWLTINSTSIELPPLVRRRTSVIIQIPKDADGEYYSAIVFNRPQVELDTSPAETAKRSSLITALVKANEKSSCQILKFSAEKGDDGFVRLASLIHNHRGTFVCRRKLPIDYTTQPVIPSIKEK